MQNCVAGVGGGRKQAEGVVIWTQGEDLGVGLRSREEKKRLLRSKGDEQKQQIKKGDSFF